MRRDHQKHWNSQLHILKMSDGPPTNKQRIKSDSESESETPSRNLSLDLTSTVAKKMTQAKQSSTSFPMMVVHLLMRLRQLPTACRAWLCACKEAFPASLHQQTRQGEIESRHGHPIGAGSFHCRTQRCSKVPWAAFLIVPDAGNSATTKSN